MPIMDRLSAADHPIPQVELEAIVCVIAPDKSFKSGLDWGHAVTLNGNDLFRIGMTGLAIFYQKTMTKIIPGNNRAGKAGIGILGSRFLCCTSQQKPDHDRIP